jgi:hypothetical protein
VAVDVRHFGRGFRKIFMHLVLTHDILPNNTSLHLVLAHDILLKNTSPIRPILAPSVQQVGRGRASSSPITDGTDYFRTVHLELGRDYQNPVRTGLYGTLHQMRGERVDRPEGSMPLPVPTPGESFCPSIS